MAKQKNNIVMRNARGMFGKQVVFKKRNGKAYIAAPPEVDENRKATPGQLALQVKFKRCIAYAKRALKNDDIIQRYTVMTKRHQSPYNVAFLDAFYSPEVESMILQGYQGQAGNIIVVQAKDNFGVEEVRVSIHDANNVLLEEGLAVANNDGLNWTYTAAQPNPALPGSKITAKAYDLAGNEGLLEVTV